ncbi:MAG TPA: AAA family ATPase [Herpetosiphonaceae bacterium]
MTIRSYRSLREHQPGPFLTGLAQPHVIRSIPAVPEPFIGYATQQRRITERLAQPGVIAISGMVGSGKTALAAAYLHQCELTSHWIEIEAGLNDSIDALLWQLAQPLAAGAPTIWRALHRVQQSSWHYPALTRLQMILEGYAALSKPMLVCIDRIERVAQSPLERLIVSLCDYVAQMRHTNLKLLLCGRAIPYDLHPYSLPPLEGLSAQEIGAWAERIGVPLEHTVTTQLHSETGGLPQALALILTELRESGDVASRHLMALPQLRRFVNRVLGELPADARTILKRLVLGEDSPASIGFDDLSHLDLLERHGLLQCIAEHKIAVHPLIQSFVMYHLSAG